MGLLAKGHEVLDGTNVLQVRGDSQNMSTKTVYGNDCNLMVAVRPGGYAGGRCQRTSEIDARSERRN